MRVSPRLPVRFSCSHRLERRKKLLARNLRVPFCSRHQVAAPPPDGSHWLVSQTLASLNPRILSLLAKPLGGVVGTVFSPPRVLTRSFAGHSSPPILRHCAFPLQRGQRNSPIRPRFSLPHRGGDFPAVSLVPRKYNPPLRH